MKELKDVSVTVRIPAALHRRLKSIAKLRGCALSEVVRDVLRDGLSLEEML